MENGPEPITTNKTNNASTRIDNHSSELKYGLTILTKKTAAKTTGICKSEEILVRSPRKISSPPII